MKKVLVFFLFLFLIPVFLLAQKKLLDNNIYDEWKSLGSQQISEDGKWITYVVNPQQGDGWLYICNVTNGLKDSVPRGERAVFSPECRFLVYQVIPSFTETRQAKKKKLKADKMPKNNLEIRLLSNNEVIKISGVKSFAVAEKNSLWMAYLMEKKAAESTEKKSNGDTAKVTVPVIIKKKKTADPKGTELVIYNPVTKKEYRFKDVTEFVVARDGRTVSFLQNIPDTTKIETFRVNVFDTKKEVTALVFEGSGSAKKLSNDRTGTEVSFIFSADTSKVKVYDLWLSRNFEKSLKVIDSSNKSMPAGWAVSENSGITFSDDGTRIFFGTAKKPVKETEDTLLEEEKFKLDIWSWDDDLLQPMQKKQLEQERKRTWMSVYHLNNGLMFQLADTNIPVVQDLSEGK